MHKINKSDTADFNNFNLGKKKIISMSKQKNNVIFVSCKKKILVWGKIFRTSSFLKLNGQFLSNKATYKSDKEKYILFPVMDGE